ncbi:MAG: ABC transporter permease [Psychromonas sp.]|nr:ABC transporter permease [Psychromonas sp.]
MQISKADFIIEGLITQTIDHKMRPSLTYGQDAWRRLKLNKIAMLSLFILIILTLMCILGPSLSGYDFKTTNTLQLNFPPSLQHWFGTDPLGRDLFSRVWQGGRISLLIGFIGTFICITVGTMYGGISGYIGGRADHYMMRVIEVLVSIPSLVMVILLSLYLGSGMLSLIIALTAFGWTSTARMIRGQVLQIKQQEFVLAAVSLGASTARIILKHLIPNTLGIIIVDITFTIPGLIFAEAFLSFMGLGVQIPNTSWGALAASARDNIMFYPYQLFFPSLMIALTMLSFSLLGDGLRDALDPKLRS